MWPLGCIPQSWPRLTLASSPFFASTASVSPSVSSLLISLLAFPPLFCSQSFVPYAYLFSIMLSLPWTCDFHFFPVIKPSLTATSIQSNYILCVTTGNILCTLISVPLNWPHLSPNQMLQPDTGNLLLLHTLPHLWACSTGQGSPDLHSTTVCPRYSPLWPGWTCLPHLLSLPSNLLAVAKV
jgi:hypothetical protein